MKFFHLNSQYYQIYILKKKRIINTNYIYKKASHRERWEAFEFVRCTLKKKYASYLSELAVSLSGLFKISILGSINSCLL
jgi:hypothetical protein